jgi:hypothetical protein
MQRVLMLSGCYNPSGEAILISTAALEREFYWLAEY